MSAIDPRNIRNIAFVGHGTVGKTTLLEALLYFAKAVDRKGNVDDGTSLLDYDEEEKLRHYSIDSHLCHLEWKGKQFQFIDAPGYPEFSSQAYSAIHNVETAAIVIDAHRGIEVNTRRMFEEATRAGIARVIILDKLDGDHIDLETLLRQIQDTFGNQCVLTQSPVGVGTTFAGVDDVLHSNGDHPRNTLFDHDQLRDMLTERIVETDDELLERFLDGDVPTNGELLHALTTAVAQGQIVPILCVSGKKDIGLAELLDDLADFCPSPVDGLAWKAMKGDQEVDLEPDPSKPFVGRVFKCHADKFGNLTYLRVYEGTIRSNSQVRNSRGAGVHRIGQLSKSQGKTLEKIDEAGPGEIVCLSKIDEIEINDVLSDDGTYAMSPVIFPRPMFPLAVMAKARGDDAKILQALRKIAHEDPCFSVHRDEQTAETVVNGMSQLHLEVIQHRLEQRDHLHLETHAPKIPYKETISKPAEGVYRHKKQTGGRGQFAEVHLRLIPRERGSGFEFVNKIVGGAIPGQYIPAVEKGIRETMQHGVLAGCEVVDLSAEVFFGKFHDVDSSEAAFKYAASMAFKEAFLLAAPLLLEPIVLMEVTVPAERMGEINGDLNSRRAHITGMEVLSGGLQVVKAHVPLAEIMRYQTELKSMTGGLGTFSIDISHLAPLPPHVQLQVTDKFKKEREEKTEQHVH